MTDHEQYQDDLKAYLDHELPLSRRLAVRRHVDTCPSCRKELLRMTQVTEQLRADEAPSMASTPIDPALRNRIIGQYGTVARMIPPRRWWPSGKPPRLWEVAAALGICVVVAAIIFPIFAQSREKARSISAASIAKQNELIRLQEQQDAGMGSPAAPSSPSDSRFSAPENARDGSVYSWSAPAGGPSQQTSSTFNPANGAAHDQGDTTNLADLRKVHNEASIVVEVGDPEAQGETVESTVKEAGGYVASNRLTTGADDGLKTASMIVKVPVAQFDGILGQIAKLGEVKAKNVTGEDITDKVSDASQAENVLEDEVNQANARLKALGKKANWDDTEAARDLRVQLAQARARVVLLKKLGEMSEIDVTLTQKPKPAAPPASGFLGNMSDSTKDALGSMANATAILLTGVIWIVVYAPIWVPLALIGRWAYRRHRQATA